MAKPPKFKTGDAVIQYSKISFSKHPTYGSKKGIVTEVIIGKDSRGALRYVYKVHWNNSERADTVVQHRLEHLE